MAEKELTAERARELLRYDAETGRLFWRVGRRGVKAGDEAGCAAGLGRGGHLCYRLIKLDGRQYLAHRVAWLMAHGRWPENIIHVNGDGLDNRRSNLRAVSDREVGEIAAQQKKNASCFTWMHWYKSREKWKVYMKANRRRVNIGYFDTKEEAIAARKAAEIEHGFHPNHGRPAPRTPVTGSIFE